MRRFAIALTNVIFAVALGHTLTACSFTKAAQPPTVVDEEAPRHAEREMLYALMVAGREISTPTATVHDA